MQGPFNSGSIVTTKSSQTADHGREVVTGDRRLAKLNSPTGIARLRHPAQIQHHLQQLTTQVGIAQGLLNGDR
jgi:hypothetical protein